MKSIWLVYGGVMGEGGIAIFPTKQAAREELFTRVGRTVSLIADSKMKKIPVLYDRIGLDERIAKVGSPQTVIFMQKVDLKVGD